MTDKTTQPIPEELMKWIAGPMMHEQELTNSGQKKFAGIGAIAMYRHLLCSEPLCRWVKASNRLPDKVGYENSVIIRGSGFSEDEFGHNYPLPFVTTGYINFDRINPKFYFIIMHSSFLTNENIEWLEELPIPSSDSKDKLK